MRRIKQNEKDHRAGQDRRAGDGADPDDFAARSLVEVPIFDGGAVFERHQEPSDDTLLAPTSYQGNEHASMPRTGGRSGQTRSIDDVGPVSGLPESGHGRAVHENTPYSFAFNCPSFAAMNARMSSAISSSLSHCSCNGRSDVYSLQVHCRRRQAAILSPLYER